LRIFLTTSAVPTAPPSRASAPTGTPTPNPAANPMTLAAPALLAATVDTVEPVAGAKGLAKLHLTDDPSTPASEAIVDHVYV